MNDPEVLYHLQKHRLSYSISPYKKHLYIWEKSKLILHLAAVLLQRDLDFYAHIVLINVALLGVDDNQLKIGQSTMNSFVGSFMDYNSDLMKKINVPTLSICENNLPYNPMCSQMEEEWLSLKTWPFSPSLQTPDETQMPCKSVSVWLNTSITNFLASDGWSYLPTLFTSFTIHENFGIVVEEEISLPGGATC
ncbi:hypothetical protein WISP_40673 [Willisornis vidua]|uniref:Uncharacterized protein n=1 Tax=Willisornis vidua TaxID=1566151 RepID=A0ABQ9DLL0_9PASS|nr:hypothetical protein WISP_40673 [Willisornis vidua]